MANHYPGIDPSVFKEPNERSLMTTVDQFLRQASQALGNIQSGKLPIASREEISTRTLHNDLPDVDTGDPHPQYLYLSGRAGTPSIEQYLTANGTNPTYTTFGIVASAAQTGDLMGFFNGGQVAAVTYQGQWRGPLLVDSGFVAAIDSDYNRASVPAKGLKLMAGSNGWFLGPNAAAGFTADRYFILPDLSGTFALLENAQTISGTKTFKTTATGVPLTIQRRTGGDTSNLLNIKDGNGVVQTYFAADGSLNIAQNLTVTNQITSTFLAVLDVTSDPRTFGVTNTVAGGATLDISSPFTNTAMSGSSETDGVVLTDQTASIAENTIYTTPVVGLYRISFWAFCSTAGTAGTFTVTVKGTSRAVARTLTSSSIVLDNTSKCLSFETFMRCDASTAIRYSTSLTGAVGSPKYDIYANVEWLRDG